MVPRGGIEPSPIQLKFHHFLSGDFPVYLPVDPALSSRPGGCDSVPPYPSRVRVTRYAKDIISAVCCALIQIGLVIQSPPKVEVTRSNRVGCAILGQRRWAPGKQFPRLKRDAPAIRTEFGRAFEVITASANNEHFSRTCNPLRGILLEFVGLCSV